MNGAILEQTLSRIREIASLMLFDVGAIKINLEEPFKLVSGNYSPIYINCRQVISDVAFMQFFTAAAQFICARNEIKFDVVAGGETAGIPFAAYLAQSSSSPMIYVRKAAKAHGVGSLVEGNFPSSAKILLVEDLITDAESKLHFIDAVRVLGGVVEDVLVLFDRQQGGREALENHGVQLSAITDMSNTMQVAKNVGLLQGNSMDSIYQYLQSPLDWHNKRGLTFIT